MKTSNKILTGLLLAAAVPFLLAYVLYGGRMAAFRDLTDLLEEQQIRVVDARTAPLRVAEYVPDRHKKLIARGIPAVDEVFLQGDTLVVRTAKIRELVVPEAEVLLLADTVLRRAVPTEEDGTCLYGLVAQ